MLRRLLLVATSAICLGLLTALALASLAASERDVLLAARRDLKTEAAAVESDWRRTGAELAQLSVNTAGDASLGFDVRALAAAVESYNPDSRVADALAQRIDSSRSRLSVRLLQFRHINPEVESVVLMSTDGQVLAANSSRWAVGQSVLPIPGAPQPVGPLPEFILKGLTGTPQAGVWVDKNAVWWVSVAPIWARPAGKDPTAQPTLAGVALLEQPLRSLPEGLGVSAFVMVDNDLLVGAPPKAMRALPPTPEPFLLAPRESRAQLLGRGLPMRPLFVNAGHVGVWAQRLRVPGTDRARGAVMLDLTDIYSALVTRQIQVIAAAVACWFIVTAMLLWATRAKAQGAAVQSAPVSPTDGIQAAPAKVEEASTPTPPVTRPAVAADGVPFGDNAAPAGDDLLTDPADAVALVKSFMAGEPLGQTKAARAVLGDLLDTVPAQSGQAGHEADADTGPIQLPAPSGRLHAPPKPTIAPPKERPLSADPEENTGPINLPTPEELQAASAGVAAPGGEASTPEPNATARDADSAAPTGVVTEPTEEPLPAIQPPAYDASNDYDAVADMDPGALAAHVASAQSDASNDYDAVADADHHDAPGPLPTAVLQPLDDTQNGYDVHGFTGEFKLPVPPVDYQAAHAARMAQAQDAPRDPDHFDVNDLNPIQRPPAFGGAPVRLSPNAAAQGDKDVPPEAPQAPAEDGPLAPPEPAPQGPAADGTSAPPEMPQGSARDQLMAMLQAKAKNANAEAMGQVGDAAQATPGMAATAHAGTDELPPAADDPEPLQAPAAGAEPPPQAAAPTPLGPAEDTVPDAPEEFPPPVPAPSGQPLRSSFFGATASPQKTAPDPYRKVYEDFMATRKRCNELGELPYGKFVQRLEATRADVIAKHGCNDVEFSAYVKNGKAALKVTPK